MKNHKKYAKLPQDLDLSFQDQLDADTADDFILTGSGFEEDDDNILDDNEDDDDDDDIDEDEEDELVIATAASSGGVLSGIGLADATAIARKQQLNKKVLSGLGRDSIIQVSAEVYESNLHAAHYSEHLKTGYTTIPEKYEVAAQHIIEAVRIVCPRIIVNAVELTWKSIVRIVELVPVELTETLSNVYVNWPTLQQVYPTQFIEAIEHLIESAKNTLIPTNVWNLWNNLVNALPNAADFIGRDLLNSIGNHLFKVPVLREILKNIYLVLEHLMHVPTYYQQF